MPSGEAAPFATVVDLEARWRPLSKDESARAAVLLADASAAIRAEMRGRIDAADGAQAAALRAVACGMVRRAMSAGADAAGVQSVSEGAGSYTASITYANPHGDMFITASERRMLGIGRGRMGCSDPFGGDGR